MMLIIISLDCRELWSLWRNKGFLQIFRDLDIGGRSFFIVRAARGCEIPVEDSLQGWLHPEVISVQIGDIFAEFL